MPAASPLPRFRDSTYLPFEMFILALTVLPILVLVYSYPMLPDRVPEYLNLSGDVEVWGPRSFASVFRLPLMAVDLQVLCLLTRYGIWQGNILRPAEDSLTLVDNRKESLRLSNRLFDWFRAFIAIKLGVSSLEVVFFSIEKFHFLTTITRVTSWAASFLGVTGALFYSFRLFRISSKLKEANNQTNRKRQTDSPQLYGGVFYYNRTDPAWFTDRYIPNFGNRWIYVFIACLLVLPLLMLWPMLRS